MSLHPITKSRRARKARGAYRSFRARDQWKPWQGWNYHVHLSKNPLSWFGNKRCVLGITILIIILGGIGLEQGPLFHSYQEAVSAIIDPNTRIWDVNGASQNLGEFNSIMFSSSIDTCSGCLVFRGTPNSTETAVALTKNPVGDLSIAHAKQLYLSWMWDTFGSCCGNQQAFGMYLTSNSTLPTQQNYNPLNDPQVALAITEQISSGSTFQQAVYIQKRIGETMTAESLDCTNTGSACFLSSSWQTTFGTGNSYESTQLYLNYTGNTGQSGCNQGGQGVGGQGCDVQLETELQKSNNSTALSVLFGISKAPPFPLTSGVYYAGFYVIFGYPGSIEYFYSAGKIPTQSVTLNNGFTLFMCTSTHIDEALPIASAPVSPSPTIDTGGFFGPVIRALIAIGVYIIQNIFNFFAFLASVLVPVLSAVFNVLETAVKLVLNFIGNLLGFGNIGDDLFNFLSQVVSFFTTFLPTGLSGFPAFMSRFFDYLNVVFPVLPSAFATALTVLTFAVNGISQGLTIFIFGIQFITAAYAFFLIFSFMVFTADDALSGVIEYLGTAEALAFFLIKWVALITNLGLDLGTWIIGLIPKPFIQMAAARLPRIPILESSARIILPSFDFGELRSGNLLSPWLWTLGFWFDTWYESRNPALPGSLCNLVSATCTNMQLLNNLLPLMQVFVFMSSGVLALWLVMRPLELLGADLGIFESIGISLGRKPVGGPGGISIAKAQKHFQGRLQKAVEKRKGVQGFKPVGPFSPGAKLEKGVGTKEAVSTGALFE